MTPLSDVHFLVLNAAHLNKMAGANAIAEAVEVDLATVEQTLSLAADNGLGVTAGAQFILLPDGSKAVLDYYDRVYGNLRESDDLSSWYERFETLNTQFIKQVTEWQNTDGDPDVEGKLIKTVERLMRVIEKLVPDIPRYEHYLRRFGDAIAKVDAGDPSFVCTPTKDSLHNIWFEFHEDILSVLGRPRDTA